MKRDVTVREVMTQDFVGVSESDALLETVEVLLEEDADGAIVLRGQDPVGVVTRRDLLRLLVDDIDPESATIEDVMIDSVPTVTPEETIDKAASLLSTRSVSILTVVNGGDPVGVISAQDVVAATTLNPNQERPETVEVDSAYATGAEIDTENDAAYSDQGICERCGALTSNLASINGQLLCSDCRSV